MDGWTTSRRGQDSPWKSQSEWQRTGINGESTSIKINVNVIGAALSYVIQDVTDRRTAYFKCFKPCNLSVNCRCTFSSSSTSFFRLGDQIIEFYSRIGRTYTINVLTNKLLSSEMKQRRMWFALWWAFRVISRIWCEGDKSESITTPRSRQVSHCDSWILLI